MADRKKPLISRDEPGVASDAVPSSKPHVTTIGADIESVEGQLKKATVISVDGEACFEIWSDEPPRLRGKNEAPQPLAYLAAAVGF